MVFIKDRLYGSFKIDSPAIEELLRSKSILRLKDIAQYGLTDEFYFLKGCSRYDHSVGTMLLLRKLGASEEEQIAGLLHDISHTAFSHLVDWIVGTGETEEFQDTQHVAYLMKSEIPQILRKYNFDPRRISNHHNFPLLERPLPALCADRVDYAIREFPKKIADKCLNDLTVFKSQIVFKNKASAKLFALNFLKKQIDHWGSREAVIRYILFGDVLNYALRRKIIVFDDFWKTDSFIIKKLRQAKDRKIDKVLEFLRKKRIAHLLKNNGRAVKKKFRYVDPLFLKDGRLMRLSEADLSFKELLYQTKKENAKGVKVPKI